MKIKVNSLEYMHSYLNKIHLFRQDEGESWKSGGDDDLEKLRRVNGYRYEPAQLPNPLKFLGIQFYRMDEVYYATFFISSRDASAFKGLSTRLAPAFAQAKKVFIPTSEDGLGYLLSPDAKESAVSIISSGEHGEHRELCIGKGGAVPRVFGDLQDFMMDVAELTSAANVFLKTNIDSLVESHKIKSFPDIELHLNL